MDEQRGRLQERRQPAAVLALLLVGLFLLRVYYGLSLELRTGDDVQIYLLGLKFFTSGEWPFFGPDVIPGQIPGALQGLLVGGPLFIAREPEAPLILLNLLSFTGLVLLGRYLTARFSLVPAWITYAWLLTLPWTLNVSTRVYNPSYLLFLSCFVFVGFFELLPSLTGNLLPPALSFFLLGFAVTAAAQIHLSWPLLLPFVLVAIVVRARERLLTPAQMLVLFRPTLLKRAGDPCRSVRGLAVATVLLIWAFFFFTSRPPLARNYYLLCPVALLTGYLALGSLVETPRARWWAVATLAAGALFHVLLATCYLTLDPWADRRVAAKHAIDEGDYRILGERRHQMRY